MAKRGTFGGWGRMRRAVAVAALVIGGLLTFQATLRHRTRARPSPAGAP